MYALFIANYIIEHANKINKPINHLKLQKLLYYSYAATLIETGEALFDDPIEKWRLGPTVKSVYLELKKHGARELTNDAIQNRIIKFLDTGSFDIEAFDYNSEEIPSEHKVIIQQVTDILINCDAFTLIDFTRNENIWLKDKFIIENRGKLPAITYMKDDIIDQYTNYPETAIWLNNQSKDKQPLNHDNQTSKADAFVKDEVIYAVMKTDGYTNKIVSLHHHFENAHQSAIRLFLETVETSAANKKDIYQNIQPYLTLKRKSTKQPIIKTSLDGFNNSHIEIDSLLNTVRLYSNWNNHLLNISVQQLPTIQA